MLIPALPEWMKSVRYEQLPDAHRKFADVLGVEGAMRLFHAFGGEILYVPITDSVWSVVRRERIREEYVKGGARVKYLAKKYGITPQEVHRILEGKKPDQIRMDEIAAL